MCTLQYFPNTIIHCIEYSKIKFIELTNEGINNMKKYIFQEDKDNIYEKGKNVEFVDDEINLIYDCINLIIADNVEELVLKIIRKLPRRNL